MCSEKCWVRAVEWGQPRAGWVGVWVTQNHTEERCCQQLLWDGFSSLLLCFPLFEEVISAVCQGCGIPLLYQLLHGSFPPAGCAAPGDHPLCSPGVGSVSSLDSAQGIHRITGYSQLEGAHNDHRVQLLKEWLIQGSNPWLGVISTQLQQRESELSSHFQRCPHPPLVFRDWYYWVTHAGSSEKLLHPKPWGQQSSLFPVFLWETSCAGEPPVKETSALVTQSIKSSCKYSFFSAAEERGLREDGEMVGHLQHGLRSAFFEIKHLLCWDK